MMHTKIVTKLRLKSEVNKMSSAYCIKSHYKLYVSSIIRKYAPNVQSLGSIKAMTLKASKRCKNNQITAFCQFYKFSRENQKYKRDLAMSSHKLA
jgi:hypothetical protein